MDKFITPEEFNLDDIFKGRYIIPIYQRPYSWKDKQVRQLLNDIDDAYENYKNDSGENADDSVLFAGTIFIKTEANIRNEYTEYTVVDGQQRITTLTLLLMVMLNRFYMDASEDDVVGEIRNYLWKKEERKNDKEKQVLTLGNIDQDILRDLFYELYAKHNIVQFANEKIEESNNDIEKNLLSNFLLIDNHLTQRLAEIDDYYKYMDFIKYNIKVISIKINTNMVKLFSIFESINSKGKPLDEIDLIKSYIFQNLKQSDYNEYLNKWGELIKQTNDNLNDYFTVYIRGNVSYYRTSIKLDNFKTLSEGILKKFYKKEALDDVLKAFINDMLKQVKYYTMLSNVDSLSAFGVSERSKAYFRMKSLVKYNHPDPLYFKLLSLRNGKISEGLFDDLVEYAFRFILTFQTISSRESKQTINVFADVQNELYKIMPSIEQCDDVDLNIVNNMKYHFDKKIYENSIDNASLKTSIRNTLTYRKNKNAAKIMLAYLLELNNEKKEDFLKLNAILGLGSDIHVDHILPQNPDVSDDNFKYYPEGEFMMLKPGQDFTSDSQQERMPIEDFLNAYLHRIGNLRLEWANDNIKKSNNLIKLEEFDSLFNSYADVSAREKDIINQIIDSDFLISTDNYSFSPESIRAKVQVEVSSHNMEDISYKDYTPLSFSLFGDEKALNANNYKTFLTDLFDTLYDLEKDRLVELANNHFVLTTSDRIYISDNRDDIDGPYALGNAVYIETKLSAEYIIRFAYTVLDEMGLDREELIVFLEER